MTSAKKETPSDQTRERILNEAEALFAQKGYHAVSVREITQAAKCNLASVNYHFGNKYNLYLEVFRARCMPRAEKIYASYKNTLSKFPSPSTADVIQALAAAFLEGPLTDDERFRHSQLISREMAEPTEALEILAENAFKSLSTDVLEHLRTTLPQGADGEKMILNLFSIFSMILHFNFARPLITLATGQSYDAAFKSKLIDHITDFALHGLDGVDG